MIKEEFSNHKPNQAMKEKKRQNTLEEALNKLLIKADEKNIPIEILLQTLTGKGQAALLILFSLPFCQPLQIPGFSIPFGLGVAFIGLRIAFRHKVWLPQAILKKEISYSTLQKGVNLTIKIVSKLNFLVATRLSWLVQTPPFRIMHGLIITLLGTLLALPIPIPLGNIFAAYPILAFGLAFLENDGLIIIVAYILTIINFLALALLIWLGEEGLKAIFS